MLVNICRIFPFFVALAFIPFVIFKSHWYSISIIYTLLALLFIPFVILVRQMLKVFSGRISGKKLLIDKTIASAIIMIVCAVLVFLSLQVLKVRFVEKVPFYILLIMICAKALEIRFEYYRNLRLYIWSAFIFDILAGILSFQILMKSNIPMSIIFAAPLAAVTTSVVIANLIRQEFDNGSEILAKLTKWYIWISIFAPVSLVVFIAYGWLHPIYQLIYLQPFLGLMAVGSLRRKDKERGVSKKFFPRAAAGICLLFVSMLAVASTFVQIMGTSKGAVQTDANRVKTSESSLTEQDSI